MSSLPHILLINPTITKRRNAKFPFAVFELPVVLHARAIYPVAELLLPEPFQ